MKTFFFKKRLNQHMYIPFSSAHPLSVKKVFVKAERTRFDIICFEKNDSRSAEQVFFNNLMLREYSSTMLKNWFFQSLKKSNREKIKHVLQSKYNSVWNYVQMKPLNKILKKAKIEEFRLTFVIKNLKRDWNMFDVFNQSNLTILSETTAAWLEDGL